MIEIRWNGFLKDCIKDFPKEICAFIFAENIYSEDEVWHVFRVKEIPIDDDKDGFAEGWNPDKKDLQKVKKIAKDLNLIKLGNIHTHPIHEEYTKRGFADNIEDTKHPSEKDLSFARRFRDIVRGIVVINKNGIQLIRFHDMFDRTIVELKEIYNPITKEPTDGHYFTQFYRNKEG